MSKPKWGGPWTELKLDILQQYLRFYTTALKNQPFDRIYIDAFAGTGKCEIRDGKGGTRTIGGSAKIALENDPPFSKLYFVESNESRYSQLKELCDKYRSRLSIKVFQSDANLMICEICSSTNWRSNRAVLFLDPYGHEVEWETVKTIAKTKSIDLWYFFPLSGVYRNMPIEQEKQDESKKVTLKKLLGTDDWQNFYAEEENFIADLFDENKSEPAHKREPGWEQLLGFVKNRLEEIFPAVSHPKLLPNRGPKQFALFFAVSNTAAIGPGMRAAKWILDHSE